MQTNPESAAVEAVANMTPAKFTARLADGSLILCVTESEHTQIVNANKSALDALRGEVERKSIEIDRLMDKWAAEIRRADAAERRVAELEVVLEQAMEHPDFLPPGLLEAIESALTKESP